MGFHLRKTKKLGLFNFNLSNSGIGTSFGIKGLRIGVDGKGRAYVGGGKGILRFRQYLNTKKEDDKKRGGYFLQGTNYKPNLLNSFKSQGIGYILTFLKGLLCFTLTTFILIIGFACLAAFEKEPYMGFLSLLITIYLSVLSWNIIYKPKFVKIAQKATKLFKKNDFLNSIELYKKAKQLIKESKYYNSTYDFDEWLNDNLYSCYINLEDYNEAYNFIKNTKIIKERRSKCVGIFTRLEKWEELTKFIQKEFTQEEKNNNLFLYTLMADAFLKLNQPQIAIDCLMQGPVNARKMNEDMCDFRYTLGKCYEAINDLERAKKQYYKIFAYDTEYKDVKDKINII